MKTKNFLITLLIASTIVGCLGFFFMGTRRYNPPDKVEPPLEIITDGGSVNRIGSAGSCTIYKFYPPGEDLEPIYIVEGPRSVQSCGIVRR